MSNTTQLGIRSTFMGGLLLLVVVLIAISGTRAVFHWEHAHEGEHAGHGHHSAFHADFQASDDHPPAHDHGDESDEDTHHHHLSIPSFSFYHLADSPIPLPFPADADGHWLPCSESCPPGPFFELIKPPQVA